MPKLVTFENREAWLDGRPKYIGSSDSYSILGSGFADSCRTTVWLEKAHGIRKDKSGLDYVDQGNEKEYDVLSEFAGAHPELFVMAAQKNSFYVSDEVPYLAASLDGEAVKSDGTKIVVEAKRIQHQAHEWSNGKTPEKYILQVMHQLIVTGMREGVIAASVYDSRSDRWELIERWIVWNDELVSYMLQTYEYFWDCVVRKVPPKDDDPMSAEALGDLRSDEIALAIGGDRSESVREMLSLIEQRDKMDKRIADIKNRIARESVGFGYLLLDDMRAVKVGKKSWRVVRRLPSSVRIETKGF